MEQLPFVPHQFLWHLTAASIFILLFFSTLIYFQSKENSFKYYAIYSFFLFLFLLLKMPYASSFVRTFYDSRIAGFNWFLQVFYHYAYFFFFLSFLNIKKHFPHFNKLIKKTVQIVLLISSILFVISIGTNNQTLFDNYFLFIYTPAIFLLAILTLYKSLMIEERIKYFFVFGSGIYISMAIVSLILSFNFSPEDYIKPIFYFYLGLFIEHFIFAYGLAYKVKIVNDKLLVQLNENEKIKNNQSKLLEAELKKKERELLALTEAAEKDRIAKLKSKFEDEAYQLHLTSLQSQMNPHFIFNALNSIKVFLIDNNKEQAIFYLNKFSKLIRKILESSRISEVSLEEELETIQLYLGIESMRFESEVSIEVSLLDDVNLKKIKVPPLILQPFVENAIWHGLLLSEADKKIAIQVYKQKQTVFLSLKDNGIGRKQSKENNKRKRIKKRSLGLKMTKERINYYNRKKGSNYSYQIHDLYDNNDQALGTEVVFKFEY